MRMKEYTRNIAKTIKSKYLNSSGFHTDRKIVVIESDDWGSIRMPSKKTYESLVKLGDNCSQDAFLRYDSLERLQDLKQLFEVLRQYKDKNGKHPCITANYAVANPNFDLIKPQEKYYAYEPFTVTYENYYGNSSDIMREIQVGIKEHCFYPQLHCREHMNVTRWMKDLHDGKEDVQIAFSKKMIGIGSSFSKQNYFGYMDALNYDSANELYVLRNIIVDAATIFKNIFGYSSKTFVASCYVWTNQIENILKDIGIEGIQTQFKQNICPLRGTSLILNQFHYSGQKNRLGQYYSIRNCEYEPAYDHRYIERAEACIKQVLDSFAFYKPAVINSHRLNYISAIDPDNGLIGLKGLDYLLKTITEKEPNIEFMSSEELLEVMKSNQ